MNLNVENPLPARKALRRAGADYSCCGSYFITVCVHGRKPVFWDMKRVNHQVLQSRPLLEPDGFVPVLSPLGMIVREEILRIPVVYDMVELPSFCVMADHVHMIISLMPDSDGMPSAAPAIPQIIQQFKRSFGLRAGKGFWQKSYYDRILRDRHEFEKACLYIQNNPGTWRDRIVSRVCNPNVPQSPCVPHHLGTSMRSTE